MPRSPGPLASVRCSRRAFAVSAVLALATAGAGHARGVPGGTPRVLLPDLPTGSSADGVTPGASWATQLWAESLLAHGQHGVTVSGLASMHDISPDRTGYDVSIRPDALFATGQPVLSADVVASLEEARRRCVAIGAGWRFQFVDSIEGIADRTIRIALSEPDASIGATLASHLVPIMPATWLAGARSENDVPAASGGFERVWVGADRIECQRTRTFYQVGRPRLSGVTCLLAGGSVPRVLELVAGHCDLVVDVPLLDIPTIRENPGTVLVGGPASNLCYIELNLASPVLADRRLRQALSRVIDRDRVVQAATEGESVVAESLIAPDHWAGLDEALPPMTADDVRQQLVDLGFRPGLSVRMVIEDRDPVLVNAAVTLQDQFAYAGIAVDLDVMTADARDVAIESGLWDATLVRSPFWRDPHEFMWPILPTGAPANRGAFSSPRVDYLLDLARRARFQEYRGDLYRSIQQIVREEVPIIPLFHPNYFDAMTVDIQNYPLFPPRSARAMLQATMAVAEPKATP